MDLTIHQGHDMGRPSTLRVHVDTAERPEVRVSGTAVAIEQPSTRQPALSAWRTNGSSTRPAAAAVRSGGPDGEVGVAHAQPHGHVGQLAGVALAHPRPALQQHAGQALGGVHEQRLALHGQQRQQLVGARRPR